MSRPQCRWLIAWSAVALSIGIWLIFSEKPWGPLAEEIASREAEGHLLKTRHYTVQTLWWTGLLLGLISVISAITFRFWARPLQEPNGRTALPPFRDPGKFVWLGLLAIVCMGTAMRTPLASKSLWWDELWNAKSTIVGYYLGDADDPLEERRFGAATMERAMWLYSKPTSHAVASVPARLSHLALSDKINPNRQPHEFEDWVLRLPTLAVSALSIGLIGFLGLRFGSPRGGLVAAFILAIQPWHVRLGIEIRAYTWVFLWTLLGLVFLTFLFRQNKPARWRYWIGFGIIQALIVWSFPYAAFLAGGFFIASIALIFHCWEDRKNRLVALSRLLFVNVLAALLFVHFFGPNLLQMLGWYDTVTGNHEDHSLTFHWLWQTLQMSSIGYVGATPVISALIVIFVFGSAITGGILLWRNPDRRASFLMISSVVAGFLIALIVFKVTGTYYYPRFVFYALVPVILLVSIGLALPKSSRILSMVGVILLASVFQPRLTELRSYSIEPLRNVAEFLETREADAIPIGYGHSTEYLNVYLPRARKPILGDFRKNLLNVMTEAEEKKRPLYLILGRPEFNRSAIPEGYDIIDDPTKFQKCAAFHATEHGFSYEVYQRIP